MCDPQLVQVASSRIMPLLVSVRLVTVSESIASRKLGHPEPESYFAVELNSETPQATQLYVPSTLQSQYLPVKGLSVPPPQQTNRCSSVR